MLDLGRVDVATRMQSLAEQISQKLAGGRVLHSTLATVGPYQMATERDQRYAVIGKSLDVIYRTPLHAAERFVKTVGIDAAAAALAQSDAD